MADTSKPTDPRRPETLPEPPPPVSETADQVMDTSTVAPFGHPDADAERPWPVTPPEGPSAPDRGGTAVPVSEARVNRPWPEPTSQAPYLSYPGEKTDTTVDQPPEADTLNPDLVRAVVAVLRIYHAYHSPTARITLEDQVIELGLDVDETLEALATTPRPGS